MLGANEINNSKKPGSGYGENKIRYHCLELTIGGDAIFMLIKITGQVAKKKIPLFLVLSQFEIIIQSWLEKVQYTILQNR